MVGRVLDMGPTYYGGLLVALCFAAWHGWLIRTRTRAGCFAAFLHNHWLGLAVFAGVAIDFAVHRRAWPELW